MAVVGICALCGADLADDGSRVCECQRHRASSTLARVVARAVGLAGAEGRDLRSTRARAASPGLSRLSRVALAAAALADARGSATVETCDLARAAREGDA